MSASDFDDIFVEDLKMDATAAPTLTNVNLDDDELFGGDPSGKVTKPAETTGEKPAQGQANWEQIGSHEQDEFLSWLDDGGSSQAAPTANASIPESPALPLEVTPPPAPAPVTPAAADSFDSVSLDDNDDFDRMLESANTQPSSSAHTPAATFNAQSSVSLGENDAFDRMLAATADSISADNDDDLDRMLQATSSQASACEPAPAATVNAISLDDDDDLEQIVKRASMHSGASTFVPAAPVGNISLDDDDDDLEQIVQKANKQANASSSRENSNSSLQIKSQVQAQHKAQIGTKKKFVALGLVAGMKQFLDHYPLCCAFQM